MCAIAQVRVCDLCGQNLLSFSSLHYDRTVLITALVKSSFGLV